MYEIISRLPSQKGKDLIHVVFGWCLTSLGHQALDGASAPLKI